jgi:hypothetical protein
MQNSPHRITTAGVALLYALWSVVAAHAYAFYEIVPDVRQPVGASGGSACPVPSHHLTLPGGIAIRWSTVLPANPATIVTSSQTSAGQISELQQVVQQSLAAWNAVTATSLSGSFATPTQYSSANACASDGLNSICFDQPDGAFTPGVLAFTRVISADAIGIQLGPSVSTEVGQILDADVYFNPSNSSVSFATPSALPSNPRSYDLQSILTHELGHSLGFSHSAVWNAMMFPFAPAPGTYTGTRPSAQQPDAPLSDDDHAGLRTLYTDPNDTQYIGSIEGRILAANPLSLPASPPNVTGIFGAHVVAIDTSSGAVIAGTLGGWSCQAPGPAQFDGTYVINHLPINRTYSVYAEPLDGVVLPANVSTALATLCRNSGTDPGWPPTQACTIPTVNQQFTTRAVPGP